MIDLGTTEKIQKYEKKSRRNWEQLRSVKVSKWKNDKKKYDSDLEYSDDSGDNYFKSAIDDNTNTRDLTKNSHGIEFDTRKLFINRKNKREFKGALTNIVSFDNEELNIITYTNGKD